MSKEKPHILFETEGSYPYSGGGVSTWAHIICVEMLEKADFTLYTVTGNPFVESRYKLPSNIKDIVHIPLWGVEQPVQYYDEKKEFSYQIVKKARTTKQVVKDLFIPIFREFTDGLFNPYQSPKHLSDILYGMWKYFSVYDYKTTMRDIRLWFEFKDMLLDRYQNSEEKSELNLSEQPRVIDMTFGMRWLYHFLMPIATPIPGDINITHATLAGFPALASIAAKYEYGIPSIVTDHGVYIRERLINLGRADMPYFSKLLLLNLATIVTRCVYYTADQISPVTNANKKWELKFEADEEKIVPIYNGVNTKIFTPTEKPSHTKNKPTVVAVAHIFPLKDIETMIRTCDLVRRDIQDVQFIVYGSLDVDQEYVAECEKLIEELGVEDHFRFGGFHDQPSKVFNEGDISILTSISEGFPYTVLESMSCARPVVSTDVGGVKDAIDDCGILCKPRDPRALADGVIKLLNDATLRIELGKKSRDRVLLNFTIEKSVDSYFDSYTRLLELPRTPMKERIEHPAVIHLLKELEGRFEPVS